MGDTSRLSFDLCRTYFDLYQTLEQWVVTTIRPCCTWKDTPRCDVKRTSAYLASAIGPLSLRWCTLSLGRMGSTRCSTAYITSNKPGTIAGYRMVFETIVYHLIALDPTLNQKFFVS